MIAFRDQVDEVVGGEDGVKQLLIDLRRIYVSIDGAAATIDDFEANDGFMGERTRHLYSDMYLRMGPLYELHPEQYSQLLVLYPKNDWGKVVDWNKARQSAAYDPEVGAVVLKGTLFPYLLVSAPALGGFGAYNCESTLRYLTHLRSAYAELKDNITRENPANALRLDQLTIYPQYQNERVQNVVRTLFAYLESIGNSFEEFETPANDIVNYFWEQVPDGTMFLNKDDIKDLKKKEFTNVWVIKPPDYTNIELFPKKTPEDATSLDRASQQRIEQERNKEINSLFQNAHNNYVQQRTNSDPILVVSDRLAVLARNLVTIFKQKALSESKLTCANFRAVIAKFEKDIGDASFASVNDKKKFFQIVKNFILRFQSQTLQKHNSCGIEFGSLKVYLQECIRNGPSVPTGSPAGIGYAIYLTDKYIKVERASVGELLQYFPRRGWLRNNLNTNLVYLDEQSNNWVLLQDALERFARDKKDEVIIV